jgi:hypothetical protein
MKFIIFSFLMAILICTESQAQVASYVCRKTPLLYSSVLNCPKATPADALHKIFENNFPEISYQKVTHDNGEGYSIFGTLNHAFYLKTSRDNKILGLEEGLEGSDCHYAYKIETSSNGLRYCNADAPKNVGLSCLKIHATDPIRNSKNNRKNCDAFLEAMLSCGKDSDSTERCKKGFYAFMNQKDNGKPIPNIANKAAPGSEAGIADGVGGGVHPRKIPKALK